MNNYEVTFIVDPVLSGDEIKATAQVYEEMLKNEGCNIVHIDEMGLKPLAYPINKRSSGVYYCYEFESVSGTIISKLELALRRDERIMRFLTVALDKHGVKYNADKRAGLIGKVKKKVKPGKKEDGGAPVRESAPSRGSSSSRDAAPAAKATPAPAPAAVETSTPAPAPAPVEVEAPVVVAAPVIVPVEVAAPVEVSTPAPAAAPVPAVIAQEEE